MKELLKLANVVAVGRGHKITKGVDTGRNAIVVCVMQKIPVSALKKGQVIPATYRGIETDVIQTGEIRALRTTKHRPAPGGVSIGHPNVTAGTLGMIVKKAGMRYILSNNHVLANSNDAKIGDQIWQPGSYDGGGPADTIGHLSDFVPITFTGDGWGCLGGIIGKVITSILSLFGVKPRDITNKVDAAIARPNRDEDVSDEILEIGVPVGFAEVSVGTPIKKSGRTTGLTYGTVTIMDAMVNVNYGTGIAVFEDQIITTNISSPGDSGSIVLNEGNEVIGLLFAGSSEVTIINKIENVIDALGLDEGA